MLKSPPPPKALEALQRWFGSIITAPLREESRIRKITPSGAPIEEEAKLHIVESPTLKPHQRIELYNQQYWWRLLTAMQDSYPVVVRLFGYDDFNLSLAIPYLLKYPPNHWSLSELGSRFRQWLKEDYQADDRELVLDGALLDDLFQSLFFLPIYSPLKEASDALFEKTLYLQPNAHLVHLKWDLFSFRKELLKQPVEYFADNPFPKIEKGDYWTILFRKKTGDTGWKHIPKGQYILLNLFKDGNTLDAACEALENEEKSVREEAEVHLQQWFSEIGTLGLLTEHATTKKKPS